MMTAAAHENSPARRAMSPRSHRRPTNGCNEPHAHLTMSDIQHVTLSANRANQARLLDVLAQLLTQA
ncbi:hypothetical protein BLA39750_02082 [Burkholderia lata]|uniref:Uncharacterized protein n=1 Tax=Burkholderia lata (strain ATCC 17760 / DSM 23089 / LMG 22485 / NCIMB 9086 / R18194 / 383) TaxID=482957 RepID=A0A6P2WAC8_BURL3|nr:hypothetical protein BLA39750_02082 [Burkholderia lata]